jgi:aldehyde:ferredoxin oxidoreductase
MFNQNYHSILYINLEKRKFHIEQREDLYRDYLGGAGLATKLLEEHVKPQADALDPAQPIIFAIGPLTFIYPMMTKTVAMFKSPLTEELGETHAGLRMAMTMRMAGYDAILIEGKSAVPVFLSISSRDVKFQEAQPFWGMDTDTTGLFLRQAISGSGKRCILRIGPAGERQVSFACATVDDFRHFGRLGLGSVMGSKLLKAIVISADKDYDIPNTPEYRKIYEEIYKKITETPLLKKYHDLGTPENIIPLNTLGGLPSLNLQSARYADAEKISGEAFANEVLTRKLSCSGCPVGCIHIASLKHQFSEEHEYETVSLGYDYEILYALGSLIGVSDKQHILILLYFVEKYGLDAMMAGNILSWAAEGYQKGILKETDLLAKPAFGNTQEFLTILHNIILQPNDFYKSLAANPDKCAATYGGKDFLLTLKGNGVAGYHTGYGSVFGQTIGSRHSHLDNAGYSIDQGKEVPPPQGIVDKLVKEEEERCMFTSLVVCLFARKLYDMDLVVRALAALGMPRTAEELTAIGANIYKKKMELKRAFGYDFKNLAIPERFFQTESYRGMLTHEAMEELNRLYLEKISATVGV